ncbi:hypothetical protein JD844_017469 [Phrynosoma platyrhinos]|uniref:Chloride channel CLIC-like protein 1 n=1 Tax=Phrynosoma platyrhinos TaxID=52577 RepID=A0ABQ7SM21_PHRPL|nr:hypothetical protein JD844_017469 [Phrynosoma platyrhinos]
MLVSLVLCAVLLIARSEAQDDEWIDPTDMLNYDAASGTMRKPYKVNNDDSESKKVSTEAVAEVNTVDVSQCQRKLDSLLLKLEDYERKDKAKLYESNSIHVFKRYLNKILNEAGRIGLPDDSSRDMHYDAEIILTKQTYNEINRFLNEEGWKSAALDDALMCIAVIVATELWTRIGWLTQLKRVMFISFLISFGWNWMYLYKIAFAQHQAEVATMGNFDKLCAEKIHWSDSIMEPLKHIGQGIGEFIRALMKEIPVLLQIPVLIIIAGAVLIFCYGAGRSVTALRQISYQDKQHPPPLPPWGGQESVLYPQPNGAKHKGGYLMGDTGSISRGPYDRGDASANRHQITKSEDDHKSNIEDLRAGDMLDDPTGEHPKLTVKTGLHAKSSSETTDKTEEKDTDQSVGEGKTNELESSCRTQEPVEGNRNETKCNIHEARMKEETLHSTRFKRKESSSCALEEDTKITESLSFTVS